MRSDRCVEVNGAGGRKPCPPQRPVSNGLHILDHDTAVDHHRLVI